MTTLDDDAAPAATHDVPLCENPVPDPVWRPIDHDPAPRQVCPECPMRVANMDRPHPHDAFGREELLKKWRALRSGAFLPCHMTSPDRSAYAWSDEIGACGFVRPADNSWPRECAGAAMALLREVPILAAAGSYEAYRRERPAGLPREVFADMLARLTGDDTEQPRLRLPDRSQPDEVIDVASWPDITAADYLTNAELAELLAVALEAVDEPEAT